MSQWKECIVVVDDDSEVREMIEDFLRGRKYWVKGFSNPVEALEAIGQKTLDLPGGQSEPDLLITDLRMPDMDGINFSKQFKRHHPEIPILLITAHGSIDTAVDATRLGIYSYIVKPFKLNEFEVTVERALAHKSLVAENIALRERATGKMANGGVLGKSKAMQSVFELVQRVSKAMANVLITGESGTGKEVVARSIHQEGERSFKPFVTVNCTAIPDSLLESELFGHVKGSFTGAVADKAGLFEEANGGTLFLDEIGDLDMGLQAKLLRVIQEREIKPIGSNKTKQIDVRLIAATHKDLKKAIKEDRFREDLFYRLNVIPIVLPALRHRREDIPLLANYFLKKYAILNSSKVKGFTSESMEKLMNAKWEGNVRELENAVERVVVLSVHDYIQASDLSFLEEYNSEDFYARSIADWPTLEQLERRYMDAVLEKVGGKKEKAAQILGVNRRTLYRKQKELEVKND